MNHPILFIHGGAGKKSKSLEHAKTIRKKITSILSVGHQAFLETNALDAAVHAVRLLEDDPDFNAGSGKKATKWEYFDRK